jgi:hypothetical protein
MHGRLALRLMRCLCSTSTHTHGRLAVGAASALISVVWKEYAVARVGRYTVARSVQQANALTHVVRRKYALTLCVWKAYALTLLVR